MSTMRDETDQAGGRRERNRRQHRSRGMYLRFAAMILTGMVVMYWTMFAGSWEWSHIRWSESRLFMALTMGGAMGWSCSPGC